MYYSFSPFLLHPLSLFIAPLCMIAPHHSFHPQKHAHVFKKIKFDFNWTNNIINIINSEKKILDNIGVGRVSDSFFHCFEHNPAVLPLHTAVKVGFCNPFPTLYSYLVPLPSPHTFGCIQFHISPSIKPKLDGEALH